MLHNRLRRELQFAIIVPIIFLISHLRIVTAVPLINVKMADPSSLSKVDKDFLLEIHPTPIRFQHSTISQNINDIDSNATLDSNSLHVLTPSSYHAGLITLVVILALVLVFLVVTMVLPMSIQNIVFWPCLHDNDQFSYIDVGLYKTRHSMYRKEVYSTQMRKKPGSWLRNKWLSNRRSNELSGTNKNKKEATTNQNSPDNTLLQKRRQQYVEHRSKSHEQTTKYSKELQNNASISSNLNRKRSGSAPERKAGSTRVKFLGDLVQSSQNSSEMFIMDTSLDFDDPAYQDMRTSSLCSIPEEALSTPTSSGIVSCKMSDCSAVVTRGSLLMAAASDGNWPPAPGVRLMPDVPQEQKASVEMEQPEEPISYGMFVNQSEDKSFIPSSKSDSFLEYSKSTYENRS